MGFRFQQRLKILPGVRLNFSKSGVSVSVGVRGAQITKGHGKTRITVGLPGSGMSYTTLIKNQRPVDSVAPVMPAIAAPAKKQKEGYGWFAFFVAVFGTWAFFALLRFIFA